MTRQGTLLFAFLFVTLGAVQQSAADDVPRVPENVAPHAPPDQPLPYSHKTHVALGLQCETCHTNPDPGSLMTFPATATCMTCHAVSANGKTSIVRLQEFAESARTIPWVRIYALTPGVTWSHRAHLLADVQCETCHGDIGQTEAVSESTAILAMATCISCHETRETSNECVTCHAWPTDQLLGLGNK